MKKYLRYLKVKHIDILIYRMVQPVAVSFREIPYRLTSETVDGKIKYTMFDSGKFVHESFVFPKLNVLKTIGKSGPAIGECVTGSDYRGQSIYPAVINKIATDILSSKRSSEVFIIVNSDNQSSIRGIEKAGFSLFAKVKAKRFLMFYFSKQVTRL